MRSPERRPASTLPVEVAGRGMGRKAALGPVGEGARAGGKLAWPTWRAQLAHQMARRESVSDRTQNNSQADSLRVKNRRF